MTKEKQCPPSLFSFRREALAASLNKPSPQKRLSAERSDADPRHAEKNASLKKSELLEVALRLVEL